MHNNIDQSVKQNTKFQEDIEICTDDRLCQNFPTIDGVLTQVERAQRHLKANEYTTKTSDNVCITLEATT